MTHDRNQENEVIDAPMQPIRQLKPDYVAYKAAWKAEDEADDAIDEAIDATLLSTQTN
mgnify:CR=1 FL=1